MKEKAGQKHKPADVFEFPDNSEISSNGSESKKDDEPYETFDPPLHSTAIYADEEELSQHCGSSVPSTPPGKATKESLSTSASEASESASVKLRATKPGRRCKPLSDGSDSSGESEIRRKVQSPGESVRDGVTLFRPGRRRGFPRDGRGQRGPRREAAVAAVHLRTEGPRPWKLRKRRLCLVAKGKKQAMKLEVQVSHVCARDPASGAMTCCLPGCTSVGRRNCDLGLERRPLSMGCGSLSK
nr:centromere protein U isoform X2 [Oryctolagus cuniculus]